MGIVKKFKSSFTGNHSLHSIKTNVGNFLQWGKKMTNIRSYVEKIKNITYTGNKIITKKGL